MSNSISNVVAVAYNSKRITVTVPSKSFCIADATIKELQIILQLVVEEVQVLCVFDHHSIDFHLSANTIVSYVQAKS
jgi:c-di-AMP phosphodiesterase-like protein